MTLFHNLFGTDASFNIWSSDIKTYMRLIITDRTKITTRSPRMVAECLLTRSMLIKIDYHFYMCM